MAIDSLRFEIRRTGKYQQLPPVQINLNDDKIPCSAYLIQESEQAVKQGNYTEAA